MISLKRLTIILVFLFTAVLLVACQAPAEEPAEQVETTAVEDETAVEADETDDTATSTEPETATADQAAVATDEPVEEPTEEPAQEPAETAETDDGEQTAVSPSATDPETASIVRSTDWVKGAANPSIVVIEYGDFQ